MGTLTTCWWFDTEGEQAATFSVSLFPRSRLGGVNRADGHDECQISRDFALNPDRAA